MNCYKISLKINSLQENLAIRRSQIHVRPHSPEARVQKIAKRCLDAIAHLFLHLLSTPYKRYYAEQLQLRRFNHAEEFLRAHPEIEEERLQTILEKYSSWTSFEEIAHIFATDFRYRQNEDANLLRDFGPPASPNETLLNLDIHAWDPVTARATRILRTRQGPLPEPLKEEVIQQVRQFLNEQTEEEIRAKALRVCEHLIFPYENTIGALADRVHIEGSEFLARAWLFGQICEDPEDAQNAIFYALADGLDETERTICNVGKMDHILVRLLLPRMKGLVAHAEASVQDRATEFFTDERGSASGTSDGARRMQILGRADDAVQARRELREEAVRWRQMHAPGVVEYAFLAEIDQHIQTFFDSLE